MHEDKNRESKQLKIHDYISNIKGINETNEKLKELNDSINSIFFIQDEGPKFPDKILKQKKYSEDEEIASIQEPPLPEDGEEEIRRN